MPGDHIMAKDHMLVNYVTRHLDMKSVSVNIGKTAFICSLGAIRKTDLGGPSLGICIEVFENFYNL